MRAHDIAAGIDKTFILSKVEIPDHGTTAPPYDPAAHLHVPADLTIEQVFSSRKPEFEAWGWHVLLVRDAIYAHRYFKNGQPRKTPDVSLTYDAFISDHVYDMDTGDFVEERRQSSRPYYLSSRRFASARTFARLSHAAALFVDELRGLPPTPI